MEKSNYNLFVAVATGQSVSNLPPILQYAQTGDKVLWLLSQDAEDYNWAETSMVLLKDRLQMKNYTRKVNDLYSPKAISQPVVEFIKELERLPSRVIFVLNGGPKLTPLGLLGAGNVLAKDGLAVLYLHGSDKPCMLRVFNSMSVEGGAPMEVKYTPDQMLSLNEIAQLKKVRLEGMHKCWKYGEDYTYDFDIKDMKEFYRHIENRKGQQGQDYVGPNFEGMVFDRIVRFFQERPDYKSILKEINGGSIKLLNNAGHKTAELDVVITLLNGTVLHFECKSGTSSPKREVKDLNSRIFVLRRASSSVGRMWVVLPYFPQSCLYKQQKDRLKKLESEGFQCLCFTPPQIYSEPSPRPFEDALENILGEYLIE